MFVLQGDWLSPRVLNLSLQYLTHGLTLSATWKHMKQHINALLTRCVLPLMCFNDEDDELWREDPQEYIRKVHSFLACYACGLPFIATVFCT